MKIFRYLFPLFALASCSLVPTNIGRSYFVGQGIAVYEPEDFNPEDHLPSPVFKEEPQKDSSTVSEWNLTPTFASMLGKNYAVFNTGDADLYGCGEAYGVLRRNDDFFYFWNTDNPTGMLTDGKRMYQSHPWLLGVRKDGTAFGIIADNTWKMKLYTKGLVVFKSYGPAFRVVVIEKDSPEEVVKALGTLSGTMELPPLWALGYQQCRYSYFPQSRVMEIADEFRIRDIPCDVIWMDIHYMDKFRIFTFDKEGFNDPEGLNSYLHENNFKAVYMIDPGVKAEEGYFVDDQGREGDYFVKDEDGNDFVGPVWPGDCHFPDFTRPEVRSWWAGLYKDFMAKGIDGVWNDMNEPSVFVDLGGTMPKNNQHKGGDGLAPGPHLRYHNVYGLNMIKASREGILAANPDKRPFVLSRAGFLGVQRYGATWTGDNYSDYSQMKQAIPMTLNMGLGCQTFCGPDMGGFMNDCTPELLKHWTASGVYLPFVRNHTNNGTVDQEPFAFDKSTEKVCRTAIERRYKLLPYYYTLFEEASRTGLPVARPAFWADTKNLSLRAEQQAFLVGNDLLVIPRWCESPALPEGDWDLFSLEAEDDLYQSYLALRPGAALPLTGVVQSTVDYSTDSLTVLVNPDAEGRAYGTLYEDAGDGFAYRNGEYARYEIKAELSEGIARVAMTKVAGNMAEKARMLRVGLVQDGNVTYSGWFGSADGTAAIAQSGDDVKSLDASSLEFVHLENGSVSKPLTKWQLIKSNINL